MRRDQGRLEEAKDVLQPIYDWFTEGFDTPDRRCHLSSHSVASTLSTPAIQGAQERQLRLGDTAFRSASGGHLRAKPFRSRKSTDD